MTKLTDWLCKHCDFDLWTRENADSRRLIIECFPAEAIWAAKRLGHFTDDVAAKEVLAYKKQKRALLTADQVREFCERTVANTILQTSGFPQHWESVVSECVRWMLMDETWRTVDDFYRGGKLLDDVVDTTICLATAMSYAGNHAHVWYDSADVRDGHIIGPGRFYQAPVDGPQ